MSMQKVKCPVCKKEELVSQARIERYRTCSATCRDERLAKNARIKNVLASVRTTGQLAWP